ncbi:aldo/keto reductase [Streptomyces sp. NPDC048604]|uniref:aldo/keto reductase n=1 Tax=Streptomyces sp. NPDC048604 TaxID=3365578 RepID=UPI0037187708
MGLSTAPQRGLFGRTGRRVSRLGLTTSQLVSANFVRHEDAVALVREAVRLGVDVVDTAPLYGLGEAEYMVGKALDRLPHEVFLIGKIGRFDRSIVAGHGDGCYRSEPLITAQFEHSLRLLRRERLDLLLVHESDWPEWWDDDWWSAGGAAGVQGPVLDVLERLREQGRIGGAGLFPSGPSRTAQLCAGGRFDALRHPNDVHLLRQESLAASVRCAEAQNMGVAVGTDVGTTRAAFSARAEPARALAREAGLSLPELGLRWLLSQPGVHTVLVGPRDQEELERVVAWAAEPPLEEPLMCAVAGLSPTGREHPRIDGGE